MQTLLALVPLLFLACVTSSNAAPPPDRLGQFSISLAVKDLAASQRFYEGLGFTTIAAKPGTKYVMLRSGSAVIGLFQGMFETNTITFNPKDVRAVQKHAKSAGLAFKIEAADGTGPAHAFLFDPDGNPVLLDQH